MTSPTGNGREIPADYGIPQLNIPSIPGITDSGSSSAPARKKRSLAPEKFRPAVITLGVLAGLMVLVQIVNSLATSWNLNYHFGIIPRTLSGLDGIIFAPLLHGSWSHLLGNLIPLLIFGLLLFVGGVRQFVVVTVLVWLISGIGVWLTGPSSTATQVSITIGASGVVFGWLAYLVARGVFTRNVGQILVGLVLLVLWGGTLWSGIVSAGVKDFLGYSGISWQAHLFGAIGGVLAAFLVARADRPQRSVAA